VSAPVLWLAVKVETAMGDTKAANEFGRQLMRDFPESIEARTLLEQKRDAGI
jgi:Tfp pilus assembly protein PilF